MYGNVEKGLKQIFGQSWARSDQIWPVDENKNAVINHYLRGGKQKTLVVTPYGLKDLIFRLMRGSKFRTKVNKKFLDLR